MGIADLESFQMVGMAVLLQVQTKTKQFGKVIISDGFPKVK